MILFVDDERRPIMPYMEELERSGYEVHLETSADDALNFVRSNAGRIDLIVLDIMMPYGKGFTADETEEGRRTGVHLFRRLRQENGKVPVIVFTNVSARPVEEAFAGKPACRFLRKIDYFPFELREEVVTMLNAARSAEAL